MPADRLQRQRMMGFGRRGNLRRDWILGALQEHLQFRARVAEHYREELYNRISDIERVSDRLDRIDPHEPDDKRPRQGGREPVDLPHERWVENRRHAANWWEDRLRLWAQQVDLYIEFLNTRTDRIRDLRETHREEIERKLLNTRATRSRVLRESNRGEVERKTSKAATPDGDE
ncbi:hypothetical protein [Archangium violaceum]|nr:hypothetical protein [Archangium violaceum]